MADLHVLGGVGRNTFAVVVHTLTPDGTNDAGVPWPLAIVAAGRATTSMSIGDGPGQISEAEAAEIAAGKVVETAFQWERSDDIARKRHDDLDSRAGKAAAESIAGLQDQLRFFGLVWSAAK